MKVKKWTTIILLIILLCNVFCACNTKSEASVWCALSSQTFVQDMGIGSTAKSELSLFGIKGEREAGQIIITAENDISFVDIKVSSLVDKKGNVIDKNCFSVFAEKYVEVVNPFINSGTTNITFPALSGFYPDALLPFDVWKQYDENNILAGNNQGVWLEIEIPLTAIAGEYYGEVKVILDKKESVVPVTLKVYNVEMPEEVHSRSAFNIWHTQLEYGEKTNYDENTNQIYYDYLLEKRLCSALAPAERRTTLDEYVEYMVELALNPKVTTYRLWLDDLDILDCRPLLSLNSPDLRDLPDDEKQVRYETACNKVYTNLKNAFTKMLNKNLENISEHPSLDMFKKLTFHFEDEPSLGYRTETIRKFNEILTSVKKDFIKENTEIFEQYPNLKNSLLYCVRDLTPTSILDDSLFVSNKEDGTPDYEKGDGVTLWVMHCSKIESSVVRQTIKKRQAYGEQFWWYTCNRTSPAPSYYVESVTMNMRLQSWQQFEHGFEGLLYWDVVQWQHIEDCDPFKGLQYMNYGSGEGILLYPGYKYNQKTPISSIRLENISQGQEDYEYLYLLNEYLTIYNQQNGTEYDAQSIVAKMIKELHSGAFLKKTATPEQLENCRINVLEVLELFANGNAEQAITFIKGL